MKKDWTMEDAERAYTWVENKAKTSAIFDELSGDIDAKVNQIGRLISNPAEMADTLKATLTEAAWKRLLNALRQRKHKSKDTDSDSGSNSDSGNDSRSDNGSDKAEVESLRKENERLRKRNAELENENDFLKTENNILKRARTTGTSSGMDLKTKRKLLGMLHPDKMQSKVGNLEELMKLATEATKILNRIVTA